jgi:oligosaccharyl transferase (archaeosortase A-associated)
MGRSRLEFIICAVLLALIFVLSLALRIAVPWDHVFAGQWIKFTDNDAYFFMHLLDNLSNHFPSMSSLDPYFAYPFGIDLSGQRLFYVQFMGFFTWMFGGGAPSQGVVDLVGVFFPAILGALMVFPVFFIGKAIFNKWAGLISALFIALIPGEFLVRTLLGNTDIHVMEIFFSTLFMLFMVLSANSGASINLRPLTPGVGRSLIKPMVYALLAGLALGVYLLSWPGALFFVLISFTWLVAQFIINHLRGVSSGCLGLTGAVSYLTAFILSMFMESTAVRLSLLVGVAASLALPLISCYFRHRQWRAGYYPLAVAGLAGLGLLSLHIIYPAFLQFARTSLAGFFTWYPASTIAESQPLLLNGGKFTLDLIWGNYTAGSVMALIAMVILAYHVIRQGKPGFTMLLVWSILTLLAALALRRFAYYFAVNVAILSGYTGWLILKGCGLKESAAQALPLPGSAQSRKKQGKQGQGKHRTTTSARPVLAALGIAAVALLAIYPNTGPLPGGDRPFFDVATKALYTPSDAWYETLNWMRGNTPEPFGDPQYYYRLNQKGPPGTSQATMRSGYSVVCWWDYGYWVSRIAHRVPHTNPGTAQYYEQHIFMAQDGQHAANIGQLIGMKYIIVNDYLVDWKSGFPIVAADALFPSSKYYEIYYKSQNGKLSPTLLYYPEYYKTMAVRLYCFDGKQYTPSETAVISWEAKIDSNGRPYKEITALKTSPSYQAAANFVATQTSGNWRIVGKDPNVSPVPLEESTGYKLVYGSSQKSKTGTADISQVKIFEYTKQQ